MTSRRPRDLEAERARLRAAADRLLAGTPLRSTSGKLTASELLRESGLRCDVAYGDHKDLVEEFQAHVKAQNATPAAMQELADKYAEAKGKFAAVTEELAKERVITSALRRIVCWKGTQGAGTRPNSLVDLFRRLVGQVVGAGPGGRWTVMIRWQVSVPVPR
ncbi:hypothetical protein [Streptomyces sp. NPDC005525]|uniref:hypothetical protein n=1 Tax=Streptomyces sp. NPDC005525 TaxID=3364720 RepID=UPI0036B2D9D5